MEYVKSLINPILTLEYMTTEKENKIFDRKSASKKPSDIADLISAFANADGGTIVIGISDKTMKLEGINKYGDEKINNFINAPKDCCKPMPAYKEEFLDIINSEGKEDRLLLLHIEPSIDRIIRTTNDSTFLRIGDRTRELKGDDLRNLEYSKSTRHYEDECNMDATIDDLDEELLNEYKKKIGATDISNEQMLRARGFTKVINDKRYLTNAAVLLFARNIQEFYPNCRIRFVKYDGTSEKVGLNINIIKDINIEYPILKIINKAKEFVATQLREFTALNPETGMFQIVPEYPEFAWLEGIVNAVAHREYGMSGSYIKITMYDDRLEIVSPGKLPNIVNVSNIMTTRYSRNPRIARVLTEFGWVRELNEGVKRIFSDMKTFYLEPPVYSEPEQSVRLVLKNNIDMRAIRQIDRAVKTIGADKWDELDELEKKIMAYMTSRKSVKTIELSNKMEKSPRTIGVRLNHLMELNLVKRNGSKNDPNLSYEIIM
ncbi:MAG: ATP-binding protein [Lachnospiraceae bacterium]|nr:ATP-binding protein [Lachnospiraceae bacterium]